MRRSLDHWFAIAYGCLLAAHMLTRHLATTPAWNRVATLVL